MGFAFTLAVRYLRSKKRGFISLSTLFAVIGVALGTAALVAVMSVTGGFRAEFQKKVLGVNAHVMVLRIPFREYRTVLQRVSDMPEVIGVAPFSINPMLITHGHRSATTMLKGIDPERVGSVLDLPEQIVAGSLDGLRAPPPPALSEQEAAEQEAEQLEQAAAPAPARPRSAARPLPAGSIVPPGGYQSELPPDDPLPDELLGDPCAGGGQDLPGIVLGYSLQDTLRAQVGDCVQVTSPTIGFNYEGRQVVPAVAKPFRVVATFRAGFEQYDARFAYADLKEAQAFYLRSDSVTGVEMKISDVDQAHEVALRVNEALAGKPYDVIDWMELNHGLFTALRIQQILMSLVLGIIVLVATFTVVATLILMVMEKKRDIAVIKTMGASDAQLLRAFLYQGLLIGLAGAVSGLSLGYVVCRWILGHAIALDPKVYFIDHLPVLLRPEEFAITFVFALFACLAATIWPALRAARLRPSDAFRGA
ncbi:MAG TPA: FtsX-like permease family protein [Polyangiaceae bacterium]|nr:FtsX-like permease family protein [Polyangiaceae bacterium]